MPDTSKPFFVMTDVSLMTMGEILMQKYANGDLHPCSYHSATFCPVEWNHDIYNRELLAVIQALKEWRHYLTGIEHPVMVITDHKNLGYFKQPQNLSRQQAHWMLFMQDFNVKWGVEWGVNMGPADALSRKDEMDTSKDNWKTILLDEKDQDHHIWPLDVALTTKIASSSSSDPIISKALTAMNNETREPWLPQTNKEDWIFEHGYLYFKNRLYIPEPACYELVRSLHKCPTEGHKGFFHTLHQMQKDYLWLGMSTFLWKFITRCANCQAVKVNTHPMVSRLSPLAVKSSLPFSSISVNLMMGLPNSHRFDSVMVVVDHGLSKGVIYCPCTKVINAAGVTQLFFTHVFPWLGLHSKVISDQGPQFASTFTQELAWLLQYDLALSMAYHP